MTAEAIAHIQPLGDGTTRIGILLGGARLQRHFGPPAPAQGEVWADVALAWSSPEAVYAEAPLVIAMLACGTLVRLRTLHAHDWREALDALAHDIPDQPGANYLYDGISVGCTEDRRTVTLTAMRRNSLTATHIVPRAPIEGEWTRGFENDPDDPINDFR